jgi:hypothetical protein
MKGWNESREAGIAAWNHRPDYARRGIEVPGEVQMTTPTAEEQAEEYAERQWEEAGPGRCDVKTITRTLQEVKRQCAEDYLVGHAAGMRLLLQRMDQWAEGWENPENGNSWLNGVSDALDAMEVICAESLPPPPQKEGSNAD